jgi:hypothetical protein
VKKELNNPTQNIKETSLKQSLGESEVNNQHQVEGSEATSVSLAGKGDDLSLSNINGLSEKDYALYMAYVIWNQHDEIQEHMLIAQKDNKEFSNHFIIHLCNINPSRRLMGVIKHYFPKMYQEQGKSIKLHYEEVKKYIENKLDSLRKKDEKGGKDK